MEIHTKSAKETQKLGEKIGRDVIASGRGVCSTILTLNGELGSGKTTFAQGFALALGIKNRILSPTYILSREYSLESLPFHKFIHIDLYRGNNYQDFASLGLEEIFKNPANLVIIEWPERLGGRLLKARVEIRFEQTSEHERKIFVKELD